MANLLFILPFLSWNASGGVIYRSVSYSDLFCFAKIFYYLCGVKRNGFYRVDIAVTFLSWLVLLAASGVWNATYCCDRCAQRGITVFVTGHCGEGERKSDGYGEFPTEKTSGCGQSESCRFEWQKAPVDFFSSGAVDFQFIPLNCMVVCLSVDGVYLWPVPKEDLFVIASDPPPLDGRRILEWHSVFLI